MNPKREGMDRILSRVRALLDKGESTEHEGEARLCREKAEELMRKYRIEEEQLIAEGDPNSTEPIYREFKFFDPNSTYMHDYLSLMSMAAYHCGIKFAYGYGGSIHAVGYEADIAYAEMLATSARWVMRRRLEPEVDKGLSDQDNVYYLRSAGIERPRISEMLWGHRRWSQKVTNLYKAACSARGETPKVVGKDVSAKDYRAAYARGFVARFGARLRDARDATDRIGGTMELHGRKERVEEAYYTRYPEHRPKPSDSDGPAPKSKPMTKAEYEAYRKRYLGKSAQLGQSVGSDAADEIEIRETTPRKSHLDEGTTTWSDRAWAELEA